MQTAKTRASLLLTPLDRRLAATVGVTALTGVVGANEVTRITPKVNTPITQMLSLYWSYNGLLTIHIAHAYRCLMFN